MDTTNENLRFLYVPLPPLPLTKKVNLKIKKSKGKTTISEQNLRFLTSFQKRKEGKKKCFRPGLNWRPSALGGRDNHYTTETATKNYEKLEMSYRGARNFCGFSNDPQK